MTKRWIESKAIFSSCGRYRFRLLRTWGPGTTCAFCMLNPSTADEEQNDPTVERCERRAREWGHGSLIVVNIFAFRSTDPAHLYRERDPVGYLNYSYIMGAVEDSAMFVCGWGKHGDHMRQGPNVLSRLHRDYPGRAHALRINRDGSPQHPLYLPYSLKPEPIRRSSYA